MNITPDKYPAGFLFEYPQKAEDLPNELPNGDTTSLLHDLEEWLFGPTEPITLEFMPAVLPEPLEQIECWTVPGLDE